MVAVLSAIGRRLELEAAVLGAALRGNEEVFDKAAAFGLDERCFAADHHVEIWRAAKAEDREGRRPDLVTVSQRLAALGREDDHLSPPYLMQLIENAPIAQNLAYYVSEIVNLAWSQRVADRLDSLRRNFTQALPYEGWERARAELGDAMVELLDEKLGGHDGPRTAAELADSMVRELDKRVEMHRSGKLRGVPTGFSVLDKLFGGWIAGRAYYLCARPGMGKTAIATNFCDAAEEARVPWMYATLEVSDEDLFERRLVRRAGVINERVQAGDLEEEHVDRLLSALAEMSKGCGIIDQRSGRYLETFESAVRRAARRHGVKFVVLDYLQQMSVRSRRFSTRAEEVKEITGRLKKLAQDEGVAVMVVAMLGRDADKASKAMLSHIKEGGSTEQDADVVMFVEREDRPEANTPIHLNIAKNRQGRRFRLLCNAELSLNRIEQANINEEALAVR